MDGTEQRPLTDSQLDRELDAALGIEPSPEFLARIRTRITTEPQPWRWRLVFEPLWGVAIVGIVLAIIVPSVMRNDDVRRPVGVNVANAHGADGGLITREAGRLIERAVAENRSGGQVGASSPGSRMGERPVIHASTQPFRTVELQLSPVLIAEDERRAFQFFVAAVNAGRVPEKAVERVANDSQEVAALSSIEPLVIAPLAPVARMAEQGEEQWE